MTREITDVERPQAQRASTEPVRSGRRTAVAASSILGAVIAGFVLLPRLTSIGLSFNNTPTVASPLDSHSVASAASARATDAASPTSSPARTRRPTIPPPTSMPAGDYTTEQLWPTLHFTVPDGWRIVEGSDVWGVNLDRIDGRSNVRLSPDVYPCAGVDSFDMPHRAKDLADSLTSGTELDVTARPISLGGLDGWRVTGPIPGGCAGYVIKTPISMPMTITVGPPIDLILLDGPSLATIAIYWFGEDDQAVAEAFDVVSSFRFGQPEPTQGPTPAEKPATPGYPTPTALPGAPSGVGRTLTPGSRHSTQRWLPYMSFEGRPGWRLVTDNSLQVNLTYEDGRARVGAVNDAYPPCPSRPTDEIEDHSAADLVSFLESEPGYNVTATRFSVGELEGWLVEGSSLNGCGAFVIGGRPTVTVNLNPQFSLIALDGPEGKTIVIHWQAADEAARAEVMELIRSIRFGKHVPPREERPQELGAGRHSSAEWQPKLTFTTRNGWTLQHDGAYSFELTGRAGDEVTVRRRIVPWCNRDIAPGTRVSASQFVTDYFVEGDEAGRATPVSVGGLTGWHLSGLTYACDGRYLWFGRGIPMFLRLPQEAYVLDGPEGAILVTWSGRAAEDVVDSFVFDVPLPPPCIVNASPKPSIAPTARPGIRADSILLVGTDGVPRVVINVMNDSGAVWQDPRLVVTLHDACGGSIFHTLTLEEGLNPGMRTVVVRTNRSFVPARIEVVATDEPVAGTVQAAVTHDQCGDATYQVSESGVITGSRFAMGSGNGLGVDLEVEAFALYRNSSGELVGVDTARFVRPDPLDLAHPTSTTPFEIRRLSPLEDLSSVETYCRITGVVR